MGLGSQYAENSIFYIPCSVRKETQLNFVSLVLWEPLNTTTDGEIAKVFSNLFAYALCTHHSPVSYCSNSREETTGMKDMFTSRAARLGQKP